MVRPACATRTDVRPLNHMDKELANRVVGLPKVNTTGLPDEEWRALQKRIRARLLLGGRNGKQTNLETFFPDPDKSKRNLPKPKRRKKKAKKQKWDTRKVAIVGSYSRNASRSGGR